MFRTSFSFYVIFFVFFNSAQMNVTYLSLKLTFSYWGQVHFFNRVYNYTEAVVRMCSVKKVFLKISQKKTEVFSCEFCEISKKTLFIEHLWRFLLLTVTLVHIQCTPLVVFVLICKHSKGMMVIPELYHTLSVFQYTNKKLSNQTNIQWNK